MSGAAGARLGLIRHGRTDWNRAHRLQGRTDRPLDVEGRAEIAAHALPPDWAGAQIVASPLSRAVETASLLAAPAPVRQDPRLIEMDFGEWEGRRGADLEAEDPRFLPIERWGWSYRPPGGESVAELRDRLQGFLAETAAATRPVVAICHIGVMRVILALAHGWGFEGPAPFKVKRLRLYPLSLSPGGVPSSLGAALRLPTKADLTGGAGCG